ncbi:MAG: cyclic nucleotide-binding domain-containing protein [Gemmatimonadetes bacterium]|nr:cyclic nucleotide-binding domain-containing protein [Gemmatimonadota bacterium]
MALSSSLLGMLQKLPVFQDLSPTQLKQLFGICLQENYEKGASLCKAGEKSDRMFVLLSGEVAIYTPGNVLLVREKAITTIGEAGLLTGEPRSASVSTESPVKALLIRRGSLSKLMQEDPALATRLYRNMMVMLRQKLIAADRRIEELSRNRGKG